MRAEDFRPNAPGSLVKSTLGHLTFLPNPLPPALEITLALAKELAGAERALGELAGCGRWLPNPNLLIRPFLQREAVLSSRIEGTVAGLGELFHLEAEPEAEHTEDTREVWNYVQASEHGLRAVREGQPITMKLIRELHEILLHDVRGGDKRPGQLRDRAVIIGSSFNYETARFVPPCHTRVEGLMHDFLKFLRNEREIPFVIYLAIMHYQFEAIHPFNDGNGRVGRLLITLILCEQNVLPQPLLYLSAFFESNRRQYYDCLLDISLRGAWSDWFYFFAYGIKEQAQDSIARLRKLEDLRNRYIEKTQSTPRNLVTMNLIHELFSQPLITISRAATVLGKTYPTATRAIEQLQKAGILREVTGQTRNRRYQADAIFSLLEDPLQPE
ncbi:MAG: Fic family protein [Fimbriiglobus sp.]